MQESKQKACMGIDVSKASLDIYWCGKSYKIKNERSSIEDFIKDHVVGGEEVFCVLESTGGYERVAVELFSIHGKVYIAHPNKVHAYAQVCNHYAKTDKLDAKLLHKYGELLCQDKEVERYCAAVRSAAQEQLIGLQRLSRMIADRLQATRCQMQQMPGICESLLQEQINLYEQQLAKIAEEIRLCIAGDKELKKKCDLMLSMPGVGLKTASTLLAELPELGGLSREEVAKLVGVAPKTHESGQKSRMAHISGGRFYARKSLYMIALVGMRRNEWLSCKYQALLARGKAKKVALVSLMRLAIICLNSMLKRGIAYSSAV